MADLAAVLAERLTGADIDGLTEQIGDVHPTTPQARAMLDHLRAHPAALTSGSSEGPAGLDRLLTALAERYPQVQRMRCAGCGVVRALPYRRDGAKICCRCYGRTHLIVCARCGRQGHPAVRNPGGGTVCILCTRADPARHEPCARCGKTSTVAYRIDGAPFCQNCGPRKRHTCSGCGRTNQIAHAITDDGPLCPRCYRRARVHVCGRCGRTTTNIRVDDRAAGTWICDRCWTPPTETCCSCGKEKPCARRTTEGLPICATCRARQRPAHPCSRCGKVRAIQTTLPLGRICGACYRHLRRNPSPCARCGHRRPLVGEDADAGGRVCGPCSGDDRNWYCVRCGRVDLLVAGTHCLACDTHLRSRQLLTGPDGKISAQLTGLHALFTEPDATEAAHRLLAGNSTWIRLLRELAAAGAPITHAMLDHHGTDIPVEHLRSILLHTGALEPRGNAVDSVAPGLDTLVADLPPDLAATVRAYASWSVLRRARGRAARGHLSISAPKYARVRLQVAVQFLTWLIDHHHALAEATQADVDRWLEEGASTRHRLRDFLRWAHQHDRAADLHVSWLGRDGLPSQLLADGERWSALRRCLTDDGLDLRVRVAGGLVLLYGQIPTRIVELTTSDLGIDSRGDSTLRLRDRPVLLPPALAALITELTSRPPSSTTPEWLFPGRCPGAHLDSGRLALLLRTAGIPVRPARGAALAALAADLPAPVLADLLGISVSAATRWSALAARDNAEYLAARVEHPPR
ncbi:hypothetical protein [Rhodococcus wratislaviensis]|uniref:hypothetical protein n=1 Tax=Rhodococcus wratislaviensis TaxID=44752 RepID=UPI003512203C